MSAETNNVRMFAVSQIIDVENTNESWDNLGSTPYDGRFPTDDTSARASVYTNRNAYYYDDVKTVNLTGEFAIGFWLKFQKHTNTISSGDTSGCVLGIITEDGTLIEGTFPSTLDWTQWHYVRITRDASNLIEFAVDGTLYGSDTNSEVINLTNNS